MGVAPTRAADGEGGVLAAGERNGYADGGLCPKSISYAAFVAAVALFSVVQLRRSSVPVCFMRRL
ncbi:hypothetical protein AA0473_2508 [Acetobacter orleanensis NRIC 0473]|uniref:Uncharacterized protein n=2 Tax=Acetobacter orleanensis TaxID=104099 RepID=A0A4Y3TPB9_9PROT|nr:hypothetical protein CO710_03415 [Acetobacter orleanensis]GAN68230.1 hypothetical protein Abol_015_069 [Acetobacter orleanensis JCM 7639]GBR31328.1 hypothetical protein AA0473_2508 [Acetobacter orleanensis NRIC 0473]GEB82877.1 hypothetical protein AOR01nite_13540 [Acetobacter orleanensis]